jgi:hypothetical protein
MITSSIQRSRVRFEEIVPGAQKANADPLTSHPPSTPCATCSIK